MMPRHHPSARILAACAAGDLTTEAALVVRAHLTFCAECQSRLSSLEAAEAAKMQAALPEGLAPDALAHTLARLDRPAPRSASSARAQRGPPTSYLPTDLRTVTLSRRRWLAPGVWLAFVGARSRGDPGRSYLLGARAGATLPSHGHDGREWVCVLSGEFSDQSGIHRAGDFIVTPDGANHRLVVGPNAPCICLIHTEARLKVEGLLGRLAQVLGGI